MQYHTYLPIFKYLRPRSLTKSPGAQKRFEMQSGSKSVGPSWLCLQKAVNIMQKDTYKLRSKEESKGI